MRRRPLLRLAILVLVLEVAGNLLDIPISPVMNDMATGQDQWRIVTQRARVEGVVKSVKGLSLIVEGEVDGKYLPAVRCRSLIRIIDKTIYDSLQIRNLEGAGIVAYCVIRRPTRPSYPGQFDEATYARSKGILFFGTSNTRSVVLRHPAQTSWVDVSAIRRFITRQIESTFSSDVSGIMLALLVGATHHLDSETKGMFTRTGTSHVLAVSGMHVMLVAGLLFVFSGGRPMKPIPIAVVSLLIVVYVVITGAEAPAVRAGIMCIVALIGRMLQRDVDILNFLGGAVLIQLLFDPIIIFNNGFILSTVATFAILTLGNQLRNTMLACLDRRSIWKRGLINMVAVNLSATAAVALPAALMFGQAPIWSPLTNMIVVPLFSAALVLGILALLLGFIVPIAFLPETLIRVAVQLVDFSDAITPSLSQPVAVSLAMGTIIGITWMTKSKTVRSLTSKTTCIAMLMALYIHISTEDRHLLYIDPAANGIRVYASTAKESRLIELVFKNGVVHLKVKDP